MFAWGKGDEGQLGDGRCVPANSITTEFVFAADAEVHKRVTRVCGRGCSSSLPVRVLTCDDDDGEGEASEDDTNGDDAAVNAADTVDEVEGDGERDCISSCYAAGNSTATTCMPRCISHRP